MSDQLGEASPATALDPAEIGTATAIPAPPVYPVTNWVPPPAPRGPSTGTIVAAVAVVLGLAAALVIGFASMRNTLGSPAPRALTVTTADPVDQGRVHSGSLFDYLLTPPTNSRPWKSKPTNDLFNLDQAAQLGEDPIDRASVLRRFGFQQAAIVRWISPVDSIVDIRLHKFDTARHADGFYRTELTGNAQSDWGQPGDVTGVATAAMFEKTTPDKNGFVQTLEVALRGDVVVEAIILQLAPVEPTEIVKILADQCAKL